MYDLVVLGGGPAGVTAALRARELGATVALIERGTMGGRCTNDGCVPARVLAKAARLMRDAQQYREYGLMIESPPRVDFAALLRRTQHVVYEIQEKKQFLDHLDQVRVETYADAGDASFIDPYTVQIEGGQLIKGKNFILCVGGSARRLPIPGIEYVITHSDIWSMSQLPESVAIIGGGATGSQLASVFGAFGSRVTLMETNPHVLASEDALVGITVDGEMRRQGIDIITSIEKVVRINASDAGKEVVYRHQGENKTITVDTVIMTVGWPGNLDSLNLSVTGVEIEKHYVKVNDYLQTSAAHIYAAGDITGKGMLVQSAGSQGRVAAENALLGPTRKTEQRPIPHGGFTDPEYAGVGLTEAQAREQRNTVVAVVPYSDMDRPVIDGRTAGFCKLVVDRDTTELLGAHVVGEQAVEVVSIVAASIAGKLTIDEVANLDFAYPTFAAIVGLAAREIQRELGTVTIANEWREMRKIRGAEWERKQ